MRITILLCGMMSVAFAHVAHCGWFHTAINGAVPSQDGSVPSGYSCSVVDGTLASPHWATSSTVPASQSVAAVSGSSSDYVFLGYYTAASGGTLITSGNGLTKSQALPYYSSGIYACFGQKFTITIRPNWGTYNGSTGNTTLSKALTYGATDNNSIGVATRTGHAFGGWYLYSGGTMTGTLIYDAGGNFVPDNGYWSSSGAYVYAGNIDVCAKWSAATYTATFDRQGGTGGDSSATVTYGAVPGQIYAPSRAGYYFEGYYSEQNGNGTQYYNASGGGKTAWNIAGDRTLYASWTARSYTVTLDRQSGSGGTSSVAATYDDAMPAITVPTRVGYTFGGYYTGGNGSGTQYYDASGSGVQNWEIAEDRTLYAKWTAKTYVVTLNPKNESGTTQSITATYGESLASITPPTRAGYTFDGYYTGENGGGDRYYNAAGTGMREWSIDSATTLYANWIGRQYTVYLDRQEGTGGSEQTYATYGAAMTEVVPPTRTGYVFGGYYTVADGGGVQYYLASGGSARNWDRDEDGATLYAKWTAETYTIALEHENGVESSEVTATYDAALPSVVPPIREGYGFAGYFTERDGGGNRFYDEAGTGVTWTGTDDTTLYAFWTGIVYSVEFDANGGEGAMPAQTLTYGVETNLDACAFVRDGYGFACWTNSSGETFADSAVVSNLLTTAGSVVQLCASWTGVTYSVTFDANGGVFPGGGETLEYACTVGGAYPAVADPERVGWGFNGWQYVAADGSRVDIDLSSPVLPPSGGATNIFAVWANDLASALDAPDWVFTTSAEGDCTWQAYANDHCPEDTSGNCAMVTYASQPEGAVHILLSTSLSVTNSGTFSFWWKFSGLDYNADEESLRLLVNNAVIGDGIRWNDSEWRKLEFQVSEEGTYKIVWEYTSTKAIYDACATGYVDHVAWVENGSQGGEEAEAPSGANGTSPMTFSLDDNGATRVNISVKNAKTGWWYYILHTYDLNDQFTPLVTDSLPAVQATNETVMLESFIVPRTEATQEFYRVGASDTEPAKTE